MEANLKTQRKILLVDDDPNLLTAVSQFLRFEGYDVTGAESGEEALETLKSLRPNLIILDMSMPGMGGVGFLQRITNADGSLLHPVLVLTARAQMAEFFANMDVDGFIAKPADPDDLLAEVNRILFLRGSEDRTAIESPAPREILLGEQNADTSRSISGTLSAGGYNVSAVSSGAAVLEQLVLRKPDALIINAGLPDLQASTLVKLVRGMPTVSEVPIVAYGVDAGGAFSATDDLTMQLGENRPEELLTMLDQLL